MPRFPLTTGQIMVTCAPRIYLASRSPRRRELLNQIGVQFDVIMFRSGAEEESTEVGEEVFPEEPPVAYVRRIALKKAQAGLGRIQARRLMNRPILAADTVIDLEDRILGKPQNPVQALSMLRSLSGRTHRVLTALVVLDANRVEEVLSVSEVRFRVLEEAEMRHYVSTGEGLDKAGAYGIQGRAAMFVENLHGSYSGVMGLPLCETAVLLRRFGYPV
jgi:septum formation protein